jgi:hypothetical protein
VLRLPRHAFIYTAVQYCNVIAVLFNICATPPPSPLPGHDGLALLLTLCLFGGHEGVLATSHWVQDA